MGPHGVRARAAVPHPAPAERAPDARMAARGEDAEWFRRLPRDVQDEYRARWRTDATRAHERRAGRNVSVWHGIARAAAAFALTQAMFGGSWLGFALAPLLGAFVGVLWRVFRAGPLLHVAIGAPLWFAYALAFQPGSSSRILLLFGFAFHAGLCHIIAQIREWRMSDGEEQ